MLDRNKYILRDALELIVISSVLFLVVEFIKGGEWIKTIYFIKQWNISIFNYLIILSSLLIGVFFDCKYFIYSVVSFFWITISIISSILNSIRGVPLTYSDLYSISDGLSIMDQYFNLNYIILTFIGLLLITVVFIYLYKIKRKSNIISKLISILIISLTSTTTLNIVKEDKWPLIQTDVRLSYSKYGFAYSIIDSMLANINKVPDNYNKEEVDKINKNFIESKSIGKKYKNIIYIQLESIMDVTLIEGLGFNKDPLESFKNIASKSIHGCLKVPSYGGKTVRTEFEVLTSQNLDFRTPGEIPYVQAIGKKVLESTPHILSNTGYETTIIHNYQANFYNRKEVFSNIGYERYIPMEYMDGIDLKKGIIQSDEILFNYIRNVIKNNDRDKFIHAITVGTHGSYNINRLEKENITITKNDSDISEEDLGKIKDYVNRVYLLDLEISKFIEYVDNLDEATLVVMYSDHLPLIYTNQDKYYKKNKEDVPYFIYSNVESKEKEINLQSYQLSSYILEMSNISGGIMNKYHLTYSQDKDYIKNMELIQYDITFGDMYSYKDRELPYNKTDLMMGLEEIVVSNYKMLGDIIEVYGENFNEMSKVYINEERVKTQYIDKNTLKASIKDIKNIENLSIKQTDMKGIVVGSTDMIPIK